MANILYFSPYCPDTTSFVAELQRLAIPYEEANISTSMPSLKKFLALRDHNAIFDAAKQGGYIGIPALLLENGEVILDEKKLAELATINN